MRRFTGLLSVLLVLAALPAVAHTGGSTAGFLAGLAHPLGGLDHLLAMVAVGLWAAQLGGRAIWAVPVSFVGSMAAGALLGAGGLTLPHVEIGIAVSVLGLGVLVALVLRLRVAAAATLVALFALFHGHTHGVELPNAASGLAFIVATAALHALGMTAALAMRPFARPVRVGGAAIAFAGLCFLVL